MRPAALLCAALLAGCTVGPDYHTPGNPPPTALKLREVDLAKVTPSPLPPHWSHAKPFGVETTSDTPMIPPT